MWEDAEEFRPYLYVDVTGHLDEWAEIVSDSTPKPALPRKSTSSAQPARETDRPVIEKPPKTPA
ncbi:MAG: hypothetical protein ACT4PJ_15305 [Gemmatimonadaceae bacterium]